MWWSRNQNDFWDVKGIVLGVGSSTSVMVIKVVFQQVL